MPVARATAAAACTFLRPHCGGRRAGGRPRWRWSRGLQVVRQYRRRARDGFAQRAVESVRHRHLRRRYRERTHARARRASPGSHILELRGKGVPRVIPLNVTAGAEVSQYLEFAESPVTGQLAVQSDPPGAKVLVDGVERGVAPVTISDLTPGDHHVELQSDGVSASTRSRCRLAAPRRWSRRSARRRLRVRFPDGSRSRRRSRWKSANRDGCSARLTPNG